MTWAEDEAVRRHDMRIVQAALRRRSSSLKEQRDYYEEKARDPLTPRKERPQWQALADELTPRVGDRVHDGREQDGLF